MNADNTSFVGDASGIDNVEDNISVGSGAEVINFEQDCSSEFSAGRYEIRVI